MFRLPTLTLLIVLLALLHDHLFAVEAFATAPALTFCPQSSCTSTSLLRLGARDSARDGNDEEDDDVDDDEEEEEVLSDASLGDWRKFRASLIENGLSGDKDDDNNDAFPPKKKKKSVAAQNEALLQQQNEALAEEYRSGVWAHTISEVEVGGLLCRMPLEAELYLGQGGGYWKNKLDVLLSLEQQSSTIGKEDQDLTDAERVEKVAHWFGMAERMVARELQTISTSGKIQNGILNPNDLGDKERALLDKYMNYRNSWQEICLVTSHNPESGCSEALILNRPITKAINRQIAPLLLEGSSGQGRGNFGFEFYDQLVQAFGQEAGVYMGGPDGQDEPARLVHGLPNLPGARELAPGTNLYQGGWEAAVEGVLQGRYQPLDFRFFLGRQFYHPQENPERGSLIGKVLDGVYQPVACARSLALKQCLGLPKPLWHEVLELCGGDLRALSSIELQKRVDLQQ